MRLQIQLFILSYLAFAGTAQAQVGIGTNSPSASPSWRETAAASCFLPPRVTLTGTADVTTIASPATPLPNATTRLWLCRINRTSLRNYPYNYRFLFVL